MRLSSQLVGSIVGITILAQIVFGSIAYLIVLDDNKQARNSVPEYVVKKISANWITDEEKALSQPYLEQTLKYFATSGSMLHVQDKEGKAHIAGPGLLTSVDINKLIDFDEETSGIVEINDQSYCWSTAILPNEQGRLTLLIKKNETAFLSNTKLASRLLVTSVIIIWIAVWIALVLSSIISKRLDKKNQELLYQSLHDKLTGLPNRILLLDRLDQALLTSNRQQTPLALLVMDLDNFKEVNDTLGHNVGDQLLQGISKKIQQTLRKNDSMSRLGGDEFAVLLLNTDADGVETCVKKILDQLLTPVCINGTNIDCKISIGIVLYPQHGGDPRILLQHADVAMYQAKKSKSSYTIYDPRYDSHSVKKLQLVGELREAVEHEQIDVYYQPMIDQTRKCTVRAEALARWNHPKLGFLPPDEFIPIAERTGIIRKLTLLVLRKALRSCKNWHDMGYDLIVAVNISAHCLQDDHFTEKLEKILQETELSANRVELEITESTLMHNIDQAKKILRALHRIGFKISIDDFGTGFSSLAYLNELPVDTLKIDKSFIFNMNKSDNSAAIVRTVIELAHNFKCDVVAEGVEDEPTLKYLKTLHNDIAQGYYFSRPIPDTEFRLWLQNSKWGPRKISDSKKNVFDTSKPIHRIK